MTFVKTILDIQRNSFQNGHENCGASIDVLAEALKVLEGFKHLNPAQKSLHQELLENDNLKYAKHLSSNARKAVRHYIVTLK